MASVKEKIEGKTNEAEAVPATTPAEAVEGKVNEAKAGKGEHGAADVTATPSMHNDNCRRISQMLRASGREQSAEALRGECQRLKRQLASLQAEKSAPGQQPPA